MQYDMTTAKAVNQDNERDDRWEVRAKADDGYWWTVSDSSEMTEAQAETMAADMRVASWEYRYSIERNRAGTDATSEEVAALSLGDFQGAADLANGVEFATGEDADGKPVKVYRWLERT